MPHKKSAVPIEKGTHNSLEPTLVIRDAPTGGRALVSLDCVSVIQLT
jgi:hypothetical protein